jgi:prepilin-type N-terminal cleavage/methylation domain-containing protein
MLQQAVSERSGFIVAQGKKTPASRLMPRIHGNNKGFTLLEVLLAFFIFAILFATIYTSYSASFKTITMTEARMELYRKAAITLERISEDIQASYISIQPQNSFGKPAEYTQFSGEDADINGRGADTLRFFSRIPPLFDDETEALSGRLVSYDVKEGTSENELILLRSENPEFVDENDEKEGLVLCDGLQAINYTYFDADGDVHDSWDSASDDFDAYLPSMVTISLEFLNPEHPENPFIFTTSVALPLDTLKKSK